MTIKLRNLDKIFIATALGIVSLGLLVGIYGWRRWGLAGGPLAPTDATVSAADAPAALGEITYDEEGLCVGEGGYSLPVAAALEIAEKGECAAVGPVQGEFVCDSVAAEWQLALRPRQPRAGCWATCVVSLAAKSSRVGWECGN